MTKKGALLCQLRKKYYLCTRDNTNIYVLDISRIFGVRDVV